MKIFKRYLLVLIISISFFSQATAQRTDFEAKIQNAREILSQRREVYFTFRVDSKELLNQLSPIISIDNFSSKTGQVIAYANSQEFEKFLDFKIDFELPPYPSSTTKVLNMATSISQMASWDRYPTYEVYRALMKKFEQDYPSLCKLDSIGTTVDGRKLYVVKISDNVLADEAESEFFYTSTMHGNETTGYVLMLRLIDYLLTNYGSDPRVNDMVNNLAIYINPDFNPDGTYNGGNSTVSGATRYNANGYDLNRNFPDPRAGSNPGGTHQPETLAMMAYANSRNFVLSANFHGGIELANFPWDTWTSYTNKHADHNWYYNISRQYADSAQANSPAGYFTGMDNGVTHGGDWYVVAGGRQDYMNYWHGCREITLEISDDFILSTDQLPAYWNYNKEAMLTYIEHLFSGIQGTVTNTLGEPLDATITVENHDKDNSFVVTNPLHGNYIRMIEDGTWDLTFSSDGYISQTIENVVVTNGGPVTLNVILTLNAQFPSPTNLTFQISNIKDIVLSWSAPTYSAPLVFEYYNIYRGGVFLAQTDQLTYTDEDLNSGSYTYYITAVYSNPEGESAQSNNAIVNLFYYTITSSAGANGTISPLGETLISSGGSQTYTITPNATYHISNVLVDAVSVGTPSTYQFSNVTANHTISASFTINSYSISATPNNTLYGSVTGSGSYEHGETVTLTATPAEFYHFDEWKENGETVSTNATLTFTATENRTLVAHFGIDVFTISATANNESFGTVTGAGDYQNGQQVTLTATPFANYHFVSWTENDIVVSTESEFIFAASANRTLIANFAINTHTVTATVIGNGSIAPSGSVEVNHGSNQSFSITPDAANFISEVKVDGVSIGCPEAYTFYNVTSNHTIQVTFSDVEPAYHLVSVTINGNGSVSPSGNINVVDGSDATFTFYPNAHYHIGNVKLDDVSVLNEVTILSNGIGYYKIEDITSVHALVIDFDIDTYTITASSGENGTIAPSGEIEVEYGSDQQFTITADEFFHVSAVLVDGVSVGVVSTYNFLDIDASHTIEAQFEPNQFVITSSAGMYGTISPSGNVLVNQGSSITLTISPNVGAFISDLLVDSESVGALSTYTFEDVQSNHTIAANFALNTYTINASAGENGSISPLGEVEVAHGSSQIFTFIPDENYKVADILVDGVSVGAVSAYTFTNISANHSIEAQFSLKTYIITATSDENGTISPSGNVIIEHNGSQEFTFTPNLGYHIGNVIVNSISLGSIETYTFVSVTSDATIDVHFDINTYSITATAGENGTISPLGITTKNYGESQSYSVLPNEGYRVDDVLVNSVSVGALTSYNFENITADATIHAAFEINTYSFTLTVEGNGSVTVNGESYPVPQTFNHGASISLAATADNGWKFSEWLGDLTGNENPNSLVMNSEKTVTAIFTPDTYVEPNELSAVSVYPNPFANSIKLANASKLKSVRITTMLGEVVETIENINSFSIEIQTERLAEGSYLIVMEGENGTRRVDKLVKSR